MRRIALDLELNTDGTNPTESIIQVGYTVFDTKEGIIETAGDYIKIDKPLYPFIINLTSISQREIDTKGVSLEQAYLNLLEFCDKHEVKFGQLVTWGSGDLSELKGQLQQAEFFDWKFGRSELNLKAVYQMFAVANGFKRSGGLKLSMKNQGLNFVPYMDNVADEKFRQRGAHDARTDALNTARFYLHLQNKMLLDKP